MSNYQNKLISVEQAEKYKEQHQKHIRNLNARYAWTHINGTMRIIDFGKNGDDLIFMQRNSFISAYETKKIPVVFSDGSSHLLKFSELGIAWMKSPDRRQYLGGMVFEPYAYSEKNPVASDVLNLWNGFAIKPKAPDCDEVQDGLDFIICYLRDLICNGNDEHFTYLLRWLAFTVQYPSDPVGVSTILRGEKGTGKSTLGRLMMRIFGKHSAQITNPNHLVGQFTGHLAHIRFLFSDEALNPANHVHEAILKTLITEVTRMLEKKGVDAISVKNCLAILMCSNSDWIVPASKDERRYFVLDVSTACQNDKGYFNQLNDFIKDDGVVAAFFDLLLETVIPSGRGFVGIRPPETDALKAQRLHSLDSIGKFIVHCFEDESINGNQWSDVEELKISSQFLHESYKQWCNQSKLTKHDISSNVAFNKKISSWFGEKERIRGAIGSGGVSINVNGFNLGTLENARNRFEITEKVKLK